MSEHIRRLASVYVQYVLPVQAACLVTGAPYSPRSGLSSTDDEWCGLTSDDVMHLVSDCEDLAETTVRGVHAAPHLPPAEQVKSLPSTRQPRQVGQKRTEGRRSPSVSSHPRPTQPAPPPIWCSMSGRSSAGASDASAGGFAAAKGVLKAATQGLETAGEVAAGVRRSARALKRSRQNSP